MKIDKSIFRAYDIRGVYPDQLNEEVIYRIGKAYIKFMQEENPGKQEFTIAVGCDMRLSSPALKKSLIKSLVNMGVKVVDIGLVSTPTYYFAVAKYGYDGGLIVSASHNPKEYNGTKIVRQGAEAIGLVNGLDKIRDYAQEDIKESDSKGSVIKNNKALKDRTDYALDFYDFKLDKMKVVADVANAMGSPDIRELFSRLDSELIEMNFKLDGTFPAHEANPFKEENVVDLKKRVVEENADLGIGVDGDADRYFFVDEKGELVEPGILRGIFAEVVLRHNPKANIGYDIRPGQITHDMIVENGGKPFVTKVGHTLIKKKGREVDAAFAGESSGHFFFKTDYGFFETPFIGTLVIMDEISKRGPLSKIVKPLKKYFHSGEINFEVENKNAKLYEIAKAFSDGEISLLDGVSVKYENWWFNVRPSNTEDKIRLNLEARTKEKMEEMKSKVIKVIKS
ncbi:MAG: Phosphomannomutase [Candidatus Woesearchaeota archaeon]|nr:Phosphomannomutase [Candidatus Woesearchaeota archaeon]